jgi:hypothetical protein
VSSTPSLPPADGAGNRRADGERRRDQAHVLLHARRPVLIRRVQRAYLRHLLDRGPSTSDPVRELVPVPAGIDPRLVGAAVRALALDNLIFSTGRERSQRPEAHRRWLDVWALYDRDAALAWMTAHPDLPDADGEQLTLFPDP